jgi:hypothetical protein
VPECAKEYPTLHLARNTTFLLTTYFCPFSVSVGLFIHGNCLEAGSIEKYTDKRESKRAKP